MNTTILIVALLLSVYVNTTSTQAQDGTLDATFGNNGKVVTTIGTFDDTGYSVALLEDPLNPTNGQFRKIVVAGQSFNGENYDFFVALYNNDGSVDNTFGTNGVVTTAVGSFDDKARSVLIQPDGKIVVAGLSSNGTKENFAVVRYNYNGTLDSTFNSTGIVVTTIGSVSDNAHSVALQFDGKIVVAGFTQSGTTIDYAVVRYNTNGTLDTDFDTDGIVITDLGTGADIANKVILQSDDKIVVVGTSVQTTNTDIAIVRYNDDGSLDNTFDSDGKVTTAVTGTFNEQGASARMQEDGKPVVVGFSNSTFNDFIVARYNTNGGLDNEFGTNGISVTDFGTETDYGQAIDVELQRDNKIVLCGLRNIGTKLDYALVRYKSDGKIDSTFGVDGIVTTDFSDTDDEARAIVMQSDGKILAAGGMYDTQKRIAIARYNNTAISSVQEFNKKLETVVAPNPFTNFTTIKLGDAVQNATVTLEDCTGRTVKHFTDVTGNEMLLHTAGIVSGLYFLNIMQNNSIVSVSSIVVLP